jgi:hypothetical protein
LTQPTQPTHRRISGGLSAHIVAGIVFAILFVVLVNVRPFSPWYPPGATVDFVAEIASPADGTMQIGKAIYGGMSLLPAGRVQVAKSETPVTVRMKVRVEDCDALLFQPLVSGGMMELRHPRIVDADGRVLHRYAVERVKPMAREIIGSLGDGTMKLRLVPGIEMLFEMERPLGVLGDLWPGWGVALTEFFAASILFGGLCALLARRFAGAGARLAAALAKWMHARPKTALLCVALAGVLITCHPMVFLGRSFVSPNNGARGLYGGFPSLPGEKKAPVKSVKGSDLGATMWAFVPYSHIQHEAVAQGEWPLRNRYAACGVGLQGQGISMFGDPLHFIPVAANGEAWAWDLKFLLARLLFAWGVGLVVLAAVQRTGVALLLAASSSFIGHFAYRFDHAAQFTMCYAPWVLLSWVQALRAKSFRDALHWMPLHVLASIALFNSGAMKEAVILLGAVNGAGLLALLLRPVPWRTRLGPVAAMLVANVLFVIISAPFWMTFADLLATARTIYDKMEVYQNQPSLLVGLFDDLFPRQLCREEEHFDPSGNFLLLLGVLWSLVRARALAREPLWLACVIAAACALAFAFGVVPPSWIAAMPFLGKIWHVDNCFSVAAILLTFVLAAFGLRDCLDRRDDPAWRGDFVMFCIAVGALYAAYFGFTHAAHRSGISLLAVGNTIAKSPFFIAYATALAAAVIALPLLWHRSGRGRLGTGGWLAMAAAIFVIHFRHAYYGETKFDAYVMSPQGRPDFHAKSAAMEKIRSMIASSHAPSRVVGTFMNLTPDFNAVYGLESPFSCDAVSNRWQWELADAAGFQRVWFWRVLIPEQQLPALLPGLDVFGVRFVVGTPIANAPEIPGLTSLGRLDMLLHENPSAWPRAFFTDRIASYEEPRDLMEMVRAKRGTPLAAVQPGTAIPAALKGDAETFAQRTVVPATDYRLTANTTAFRVNATAPGAVVLGEAFEQGNYLVTVDGKKAEPFRVNHAFLGVLVDSAGPHEIVCTYRPRLWRLSLCAAALGLLLASAAGMWAARRVAA